MKIYKKDLYNSAPVWKSDLDVANVLFSFNNSARKEISIYIRQLSPTDTNEKIEIAIEKIPHFIEEVERCRTQIENGMRLAIVQPVTELTIHEKRILTWVLSNVLGQPLVQNSEGNTIIEIYDRGGDLRLEEGARYHQTRQGGSAHTDNVNIPEYWDYLLFSCVAPAMIGGESILISGFTIHNKLQEYPEVLEILTEPFWWEYRGISDELFQSPIIKYNSKGEPLFRYLRKYMESAHQKAEHPLTHKQIWALDVFDSLLEFVELQFRHRFQAGETLITVDSQILHARTSFADYFAPQKYNDISEEATSAELNRYFERLWVRCKC